MEFEANAEDVQNIRDWITKKPYLVQDYDDDIIKSLIRASKGSLQKTKECIEKLNSIGKTYPLFQGHLDPFDVSTQYFINHEYFFPMEAKTEDGCIVLISVTKNCKIDGDKYSSYELIRYAIMTVLVLLWEKEIGASKFILITSSRYATIDHLRKVTPIFIKQLYNILRSLPVRLQGIHTVELSRYLSPFFMLMKTFLSKKLSDRMQFYSTMDKLHDVIPKKCLPKEFGGTAGDMDTLHWAWKKKVESFRDRLVEESNKMRKLDNLRPKSNEYDEPQGSFRLLHID